MTQVLMPPDAPKAVEKGQPSHFAYLDSLRGWAAASVIFTHVVQAMGNAAPHWLQKGGHFGSLGVQLFFVLSAVTLLMSYETRAKQDSRPVAAFLVRRFFRIAPLFWAAAVINLVQTQGAPGYWAPSGIHAWQVIATLTFFHGWAQESINSVVPGGWSIAVEMNFYLLLPIIRRYVTSMRRAGLAFGASFLFSMAAAALARRILQDAAGDVSPLGGSFLFFWFPRQLPVFFLGFITYFWLNELGSAGQRPVWYRALPLLSVVMLLVLGNMPLPQQFTVMSVAFVLLTVGLASYPWRLLVNPVMGYLGKISFSSYLTHFAVLAALEHAGLPAWAAADNEWHPLRFVLFYVLATGVTAAVATLSYRALEIPGQNLGKRVLRQMGWERSKVSLPAAAE